MSAAAPDPRRLGVWVGVCVLLLAVLGALDGFSLWHMTRYQLARRDIPGPLFNAAAYASAYVVGIVALAFVLTQRRAVWRWIGIAWIALTAALELGYRAVNAIGYRLHDARLAFDEAEFIGAALAQFAPTFAPPAIAVAIVALGVALVVRRPRLHVSGAPWLAAVVIAFAMQQFVLQQTLSKVYHFPIPYRVPLLTAYAATHRSPYYGPREATALAPAHEPAVPHLLVLMDESVRGDALSLNGSAYETTPFLDALGDRVLNFGVVPAISNLSATTNIVIQSGLRPDELPDVALASLKRASVFDYLQQAGFTSHLIDAQIYSDDPPNHLSGFDLERLDGHEQIKRREVGLPEHALDRAAIASIDEIQDASERSFTWFLKLGAHFLYEGKYPESERIWEPTLAFREKGRDRERTRNSYHNAVRWAVDGFWRELHERLEESGRDVIVIYTSDHGQSLLEIEADQGRMPHGTIVDPPVVQAMVPLFVVGYGRGEDFVREHAARLRTEGASQFELFATLLTLAGYDEGQVRERFGASLFAPDRPDAPRRFWSGSLFGADDSGAWNAYAPPVPQN